MSSFLFVDDYSTTGGAAKRFIVLDYKFDSRKLVSILPLYLGYSPAYVLKDIPFKPSGMLVVLIYILYLSMF